MASRIVFAVFIAFCVFQVLTWESEARMLRRARDAPAASSSQTVEEAFNNLKQGFDDILKNIQNNDLVQNMTTNLKNLGDKINDQIKDKLKTEK